ncbi:MAG: ERF family protein, partial [Anaerolineae bacterium]|nr:ERF family protein [Anaerolineae bacterium]
MAKTMDDNLTLSERIAKASIALGSFAADKRNKEQGYAYISAEAVLSRGGNALARQGLAVFPSITEVEVKTIERLDASGKLKGHRYDAMVKFVMSILDGTTARDCLWVGAGSDYTTPDKAIYKAITSGHKYFLMKLLEIGAGNEDSEHDDEPAPRTIPARN